MTTTSRTTGGPADKALDRALEASFPASDRVAIEQPVDPSPQPVTETATQARQGVTGHNVRYVLTYGLVGAIAALALAYLYYNA